MIFLYNQISGDKMQILGIDRIKERIELFKKYKELD